MGADAAAEHGSLAGEGSVPDGLLESFLPSDRRIALAQGRDLPDRTRGSALLADISGFTPLTEALVTEFGPQRGAEELDRNLNRVYERLIGDLTAQGGVVVYLSGDAITCWIDGDDGTRAVWAALQMQDTMGVIGRVVAGTAEFTLAIKVAVAVGEARRFAVGDPALQVMDVLAGRVVEHLAAAEGVAEKGEVVVDESVLHSLGDGLVCREVRGVPDTGRRCGVVEALRVPPAEREPMPLVALPIDVVRSWVLPEVLERIVVGGGLFLAELRAAHPIFVKFAGFDFDEDPDLGALDTFVRAVQEVLGRYDGTLLGITIGDKGAYLNAVMGAPRSHEDDAHRAVAAAVEIRDLEASTAAEGLQIGVSVGRVYSGTYGAPDRRTLSVLGDPTNVAARLMSKAPPGEVYVLGEVADAVDDRFVWTELEPLALKGKREPVRARVPVVARRRREQRVRRYPLPMVGRSRELATVRDAMNAVRAGERRVLAIAAEAGMGKSRFVAEVLRDADSAGLPIAYGQAESLGRTTSYVLWREPWRVLLGLDDNRPDADQILLAERVVRAVDDSFARRLPLLGPVVGLEIPDNDLVAHFDPKLRKESLENLLAELLAARLAQAPLLLVLEDLHWMDPLSADLLHALVRRTADLGVLFLLAYRRDPSAGTPPALAGLPGFEEIELRDLDADGMRSVVEAKVQQVFGEGVATSEAMHSLIAGRAQGNPFYAEELVNYLRRLGLDPGDAAALATVSLPDSLQSVVLSRIDGLDEAPRQTLKVASVVGREFRSTMLPDLHQSLGGHDAVVRHLEAARSVDLVVPDRDSLAEWLFRHAITRDVAYESIPFSVRGALHERIGDTIARADHAGTALDLLAHHYWHSDNVDKKRRFLRRAGDAARAAYANEAAIEHYRRLGSVVPDDERAQVLLDLAGVLELTGSWGEAQAAATGARELAMATGQDITVGWCDVALGEIARKNGRFDDAIEALGQARFIFDAKSDAGGAARALHLLGTIAAQRGELDEARRLYDQSRALREDLGDLSGLAALLSNLGVVSNYEGDYDAAAAFHERSLELRRRVGDRWAIAVSYTNLGILADEQARYDEALELFQESMRLNTEVGDLWMVAIAHNNLGNACRGLGAIDEARGHYAAALDVYRSYNDRWAMAFLLEDIAMLAGADEPHTAQELLGAADRLRSEIDAPRPQAIEDQITQRLGPGRAVLSDAELSAARTLGRTRSEFDAIGHARAYCRNGAAESS